MLAVCFRFLCSAVPTNQLSLSTQYRIALGLYKLAAFFEFLVLVMSAAIGFVNNGIFVLIVIDMALMLLLRFRPATQVKLLAAEGFEREYEAWADNRQRAAAAPRVLRAM